MASSSSWIFSTLFVVVVVVLLLMAVEEVPMVSAFQLQQLQQQQHPFRIPRNINNDAHHHQRLVLGSPLKISNNSNSNNNNSDNNFKSKSSSKAMAAQAALERTAAHLEKLQQQSSHSTRRRQRPPISIENEKYNTLLEQDDNDQIVLDKDDDSVIAKAATTTTATDDPLGQERELLYREYLQLPANTLKQELQRHQLPNRGRKPDLARRLVQFELHEKYGSLKTGKEDEDYYKTMDDDADDDDTPIPQQRRLQQFAGLRLSESTSAALGRAGFTQPSPIQAAAIPVLAQQQSCLLHAATGYVILSLFCLSYTYDAHHLALTHKILLACTDLERRLPTCCP